MPDPVGEGSRLAGGGMVWWFPFCPHLYCSLVKVSYLKTWNLPRYAGLSLYDSETCQFCYSLADGKQEEPVSKTHFKEDLVSLLEK